MQQLSKKSIEKLEMIILKSNPLTGKGLSNFIGKNMKNLNYLVFSETFIGDEGVMNIVENSYERMFYLDLSNSDITAEGVQYLNRLKAPRLNGLDLSDNGLTVDDLLQLDFGKFPYLIEFYFYPSITSEEANKLAEHIKMGKGSSVFGDFIPFQIYTNIVEPTNKLVVDDVEYYEGSVNDEDE